MIQGFRLQLILFVEQHLTFNKMAACPIFQNFVRVKTSFAYLDLDEVHTNLMIDKSTSKIGVKLFPGSSILYDLIKRSMLVI